MIRPSQYRYNDAGRRPSGGKPVAFQDASLAHRAAVRRKMNDLVDAGAIVPTGNYGAYIDKILACRKAMFESCFAEAGEDTSR